MEFSNISRLERSIPDELILAEEIGPGWLDIRTRMQSYGVLSPICRSSIFKLIYQLYSYLFVRGLIPIPEQERVNTYDVYCM